MSYLLRFQDLPQYYKHNLVNFLFHSNLFKSVYDPRTECPNEYDLRNYIQKFLDDINSHHPLYSKCILNKDYTVECFLFCMSVSNIKRVFKDIITLPEHHEFLKTLASNEKIEESFLVLGYCSENQINSAALQSCLSETIKSISKDYKLSEISFFSTYDDKDINSIYKSFNYTFKSICTSIHIVEDNFHKILFPKSPITIILSEEEKEEEEEKKEVEFDENFDKIINPFSSQKSHIKLEWCTSKGMPLELANSDNPYEIINNLKSEKDRENFIEEMKGIDLITDAFLTDPCLFFMISGYINKPERINPSDYSEETISLVNKCMKPMLQGGIESYASHGCCLFAKSNEEDSNNELVGGLAFSIFDSRESIDKYELRKFTNFSNGIFRNKNVNYMALLRGISIEFHYKFIRESFVGKNSEYIYVHILAVFSNVQGKGYGSELLKALIRYSEIFHLKIVLETHKYENVLFYQKFGFVLKNVDEGYYFYKLPKAYLLIREPNNT